MTRTHIVTSISSIVLITLCAVLGVAWIAIAEEESDSTSETQPTSIANNLGLFGGSTTDIAIDATNDVLYLAVMSPNGIFVSSDIADEWTGLPSTVNYGVGKAVEVDSDTGTAYALIGDTLLRSTDQGENWDDIGGNITTPSMGQVMLFAHGRVLVAQNDGKVVTSDDDGETFSSAEITTGGSITSLAAASNSEVYYAVVTAGNDVDSLYRSTDSGATWTDMNVYSAGVNVDHQMSEVGVDPFDDNHLVVISDTGSPAYQTFDAGATWEAITNDGSAVNGGHVTWDANGRIYIGFLYTDNPAVESPVWSSVETSTPLSSIAADQFLINPDDTAVLYTNSGIGFAKSTDGGETWEDSVEGLIAVKAYDIVQSNDKEVVWIGADGGLAKTENFTDDEPTWEYPITPSEGISDIWAVWVDPEDPNIVVAGMSTFLSYSEDSGITWTQSSAPEFGGVVLDIEQSNLDDETLYAVTADYNLSAVDTGTVLMSGDRGVTWTDLEVPGDLPARELAVGSDDTLYVGIGGDAEETGVYTYTSDVGWAKLDEFPVNDMVITSIVVDTANSDRLYVTTADNGDAAQLYVSEDGGATWTQLSTGLEEVHNLDTLTLQDSTTPSTLYVAGQGTSLDGEVYKSSDGGETWSLFYTGMKQESFYAMLFDGLLLGNDRGIYSLQSRATLRLRVADSRVGSGDRTTVTVLLKDKTTQKRIKNQRVKLYKKTATSDGWKMIGRVKTDAKGKAHRVVRINKTTRLKARWVPQKKAANEYAKATSTIEKVQVE